MKKVYLIIVSIMFIGAAHAACPSGWEEVPMETTTLTDQNGACPSGTESYYHIDNQCNANIY